MENFYNKWEGFTDVQKFKYAQEYWTLWSRQISGMQ